MIKLIYPPPPTRFAGTPVQPSLAAGTRAAGARATHPPPPTRYGAKPVLANAGTAGTLQPASRAAMTRLTAPPPPRVDAGSRSRVIQRASDIDDPTWTANHQGTIALGTGAEDDDTNELSQVVTPTISVVIKEKDLNHFCTGHTVREFSFVDANIRRSPVSTFWPAATTRPGVLAIATAVLQTLHSDIKTAIGEDSSVNHSTYLCSGVRYAVTISTEPKTGEDDPIDDMGNYLAGVARLEQFYPVSGTGILSVDQAELLAIKIRLGK